MIKVHFRIKLWNSNLALYSSFLSYIAQNKQNCFINKVRMQLRERVGRLAKSVHLLFSWRHFFFLKFIRGRLGIKKLACFTVRTLWMASYLKLVQQKFLLSVSCLCWFSKYRVFGKTKNLTFDFVEYVPCFWHFVMK